MVATAPTGPKMSYFTRLGLNGLVSFASPLPGRVVSLFEPKNPRSRSTQKPAIAATTTMISSTHNRLSTGVTRAFLRSGRFRGDGAGVGAGTTGISVVAGSPLVATAQVSLLVRAMS